MKDELLGQPETRTYSFSVRQVKAARDDVSSIKK